MTNTIDIKDETYLKTLGYTKQVCTACNGVRRISWEPCGETHPCMACDGRGFIWVGPVSN